MFPHATCFCIKNQQQIEHEQQCQFQNQVHLGTKYANHCETNPWIIQRRADFVKINVLSSSQASLILQQTKRQLYNEQVSHICPHSRWMNFFLLFFFFDSLFSSCVIFIFVLNKWQTEIQTQQNVCAKIDQPIPKMK